MRTYTGNYTVSGVTYGYEVEIPEALMFVYSRHNFCKIKVTDSDGSAVIGRKIQLVLRCGRNMLNGEYRILNAEGKATFDIAELAQVATDNREDEIKSLFYNDTQFAQWQSRMIQLSFYDTGVVLYSTTLQTMNGAHDNAVDWWDKTRRLKWWKNYPFTFDFVNVTTVQLKKGSLEISPRVPYVESNIPQLLLRYNPHYFGDNVGSITISTKEATPGVAIVDGIVTGMANSVTLEIDGCAEDLQRKTYLRWLGSHGEVFYWLFDTIEDSVSVTSEIFRSNITSDVFTLYGEDNAMRPSGIAKHSEKKRKRTIATGMLDKDYYDVVSSVLESPFVDMYLGNGRWERVKVKVDDGSLSRNPRTADMAKTSRIALTIEIGE